MWHPLRVLVFAGALLRHLVPATSTLCAAVRGCEQPAELLLFAADLVKKFTMPAKKEGGEEKENRENEKQSMKLMKVGEYFWCYNVARIRFL